MGGVSFSRLATISLFLEETLIRVKPKNILVIRAEVCEIEANPIPNKTIPKIIISLIMIYSKLIIGVRIETFA
jgi:hypothetical protein